MSTRTIIEINHDDLIKIYKNDESWKSFLTGLACGEFTTPTDAPDGLIGVRVLGQRHHSETLKLEVS